MYKQSVFKALLNATHDKLFPIFVLYVHNEYNETKNIVCPWGVLKGVVNCGVLTSGKFINGSNFNKSLINYADKKLLYIPDFAECMKQRRFDDLAFDLRHTYDGELINRYANGREFHWKGTFNLFTSINEKTYHRLCLKYPGLVNRMVVILDKQIIDRESKNTFISKYLPERKYNR